jgi:hypothetical protein
MKVTCSAMFTPWSAMRSMYRPTRDSSTARSKPRSPEALSDGGIEVPDQIVDSIVLLFEPHSGVGVEITVKNAVRSDTRAACCMLWVTMTIVYSLLELAHQVLDAQRGDRVERRARLVHEDHVGLGGDGPGDAQPLLLAAGQP